MTIQIDFVDGHSEEYHDCDTYSNDGKIVSFIGFANGDETKKTWELNFDHIETIARF